MVAQVVLQLVKPCGASLLLAEFRDRYPTNLAAFQNLLQVKAAALELFFEVLALSVFVINELELLTDFSLHGDVTKCHFPFLGPIIKDALIQRTSRYLSAT